jgi:hypothetical protein
MRESVLDDVVDEVTAVVIPQESLVVEGAQEWDPGIEA